MEDNKKTFKLFRERSLESIESPESLNDYLQVTSPGVWLVLAAIIAILIGAVLWSVFGRINTSANVAVVSEDGNQNCFVPYDKLEGVMSAGVVDVNGEIFSLQMDSSAATMIVSEQTNPYIRLAGDFQIGDVAVQIPLEADLPSGVYSGIVITESLQPIKLLIQ